MRLRDRVRSDEIKQCGQRNVVQSRAFSERLQKTLTAYRNRAIATQEVIDELIQLAKEMQAATQRGEDLGLSEDEICFYDALAMNESAVKQWAMTNSKSSQPNSLPTNQTPAPLLHFDCWPRNYVPPKSQTFQTPGK